MGMEPLRVALMTDKAKEPQDQIIRQPEVKPLASSDAQTIATPSALDKQTAETDRTNRSSGSLTELALKSRGMTREQVAAQLEAQGDSVSIDFGNGQEASRKSGLTEASLKKTADDSSESTDSQTILKKLFGQVEERKAQQTIPDGWLEAGRRIAELPAETQLEVIGTGLMAGHEQYLAEEREKAWGRLIGTTEGLGAAAVNLATIAEFTCDVIAGNKARAEERGGQFGKALGETLVSGIQLFSAADQYLFNVGYFGEYGKPFKDLADFGGALNERWSQIPPREQERIKYKLITEMAADGFIGAGGARAIGKAKTFTEVLDAVAIEAKAAGKGSIDAVKGVGKQVATDLNGMRQDVATAGGHVTRYIDDLVWDLTAPEMALPGGGKIKFPRELGRPADKPVTHVLMSKADDVSGSGKLVHKGVDAAGKALRFSEESGIKLNYAKQGQDDLWIQVPVLRGNDVHVGLGENLPPGTKTIDGIHISDGIATSIKSINPRDMSYQKPGAFESKLRGYVHDLENYKGRQTKTARGLQLREAEIDQKVLHIGIPDGAISDEQIKVLEKIGKQVQEYNSIKPIRKAPIQIEVTILE